MDHPRKDDHLVEPLFSGLGVEPDSRASRQGPGQATWIALALSVAVIGFLLLLLL